MRWLISFAVFLTSASVHAATYYIDADSGSDTRSGTSPANAWQTLGRIARTMLAPGDTVLLRRGAVWHEKLVLARSGNAGAAITVGAYGTGNAPRIDGSDPVSGWSLTGPNRYGAALASEPEVVFTAGSFGARVTSLDELNASGAWHWADGVLSVYSEGTPVSVMASTRQFTVEVSFCSHVVLRDIEIVYAWDPLRLYDTTHVTLQNLLIHDSAGYAGVVIGALSADKGANNTVRGCSMYGMRGSRESLVHGGNGHGVLLWGLNTCRNNLFADNVLHDNGGGGILLIDTSGNTVRGNDIQRHGNPGIVVSGLSSDGNLIEHNHVTESCRDENDCFGINLFMVGNNNVVRYNTCHGQYIFTDEEVGIPGFMERSGAIRFDGDTYTGVTDKTGNRVHGNVVYDEYDGIQIFNYSGVEVFNNTVRDLVRHGINISSYGATGTTNGTVVKNNIVHTSQSQLVRNSGADSTVFDNNVYYPAGNRSFNWNNAAISFTQWRNASGGDAAARAADPLFVNAAAHDYRLQTASPAIDMGVTEGAPTRDIAGTSRPQGAGMDAGAYEYFVLPAASFTAFPLTGSRPLTVQFSDTTTPGTSPITSWSWDLDGNGVEDSTAQHPSFTYTADGRYTVQLTVTTGAGANTHTESDFIHVTSGPSADFTGTPTAGVAPLTVLFTDRSEPGSFPLTGWSWDFDGDGIEDSDERNPAWIFGAGTHTVSLTITASDGQSDTLVRNGHVTAELPPAASFTAAPTSGFSPLDVQFTDTSAPGSRPISNWLWDFGDGNTSTAQHPSHRYQDAGLYTVRLTVTTAAGSDMREEPALVQAVAAEPPAAEFTGAPTAGLQPLAVQFTDASSPGTFPITTWNWDFGDGNTSTAQHPLHVYENAGNFTVSLTVASSGGTHTKTRTNYVGVTAATGPTADFSVNVARGRTPLPVQFTDTSQPGAMPVTQWLWSFGDGNTSTAQHPSHTYLEPGAYTVSLTVTTALGVSTRTRERFVEAFGVVHVNRAEVPLPRDGTNWTGALATIQEGIDLAAQLGGGEVWVAGGVYAETRANEGSLLLRDNVAVYGGFAGVETQRAQRDPAANPATIDGLRARNGQPAYHVVTAANGAVLDGFVVTGGRANGGGTRSLGGGMFNDGVSPLVRGCTFTGNEAARGGAVYIGAGAAPRFESCIFRGNAATSGFASGGQGGASYTDGGAAPVFENCVFNSNEARAALFNDGLGGALYTSGAAPHVVNCTFARNQSYGSFFSNGAGGALYNLNASTRTFNSVLWGNQPNQAANSGGAPTFDYCDVQGGMAGAGNISLDPRWTNADGGDFTLRADSPCIDRGTAANAPESDIRGVFRPQGAGVDMGAYEWGDAPRAAFDAAPARGPAPLTVAFTDNSTPGTSPITAWEWRDGATVFSTEPSPSHMFTEPGTHIVTLTVRSDAGQDASEPFAIEVEALLLLTDHPDDLDVYTGEGAAFRIRVEGAKAPVTYQWWHDDGGGMPAPVECDYPELSIGKVGLSDAGHYWCIVSDGNNEVSSETARMRVADPLSITTPLQDAAVPEGAPHAFEIAVHGGFTPLSFVWERNGAPLDADGSQFAIPGVSPQDQGVYRVTVSDLYTTRQDSASLTVLTGVPAHTPAVLAILAAVLAAMGALAATRRAGAPVRR